MPTAFADAVRRGRRRLVAEPHKLHFVGALAMNIDYIGPSPELLRLLDITPWTPRSRG
jgi:hypothetical protein